MSKPKEISILNVCTFVIYVYVTLPYRAEWARTLEPTPPFQCIAASVRTTAAKSKQKTFRHMYTLFDLSSVEENSKASSEQNLWFALWLLQDPLYF